METIEFKIFHNSVAMFKGAARELEIDMIVEKPTDESGWLTAHVIVHDYTSLVSLAYIAGVNTMYNTVVVPLKELTDSIENKKNNPDESR